MRKKLLSILLICALLFTGIDFSSIAAEIDNNAITKTESESETEELTDDFSEGNQNDATESDIQGDSEIENSDDSPVEEESGTGEDDTEIQSPDDTNSGESYEIDNNENITEDTEEENIDNSQNTEDESIENAEMEEFGDAEASDNSVDLYSSSSVNDAVYNKIISYKSTYPEGYVWQGSFAGGKQCYGFALLMANHVFGCYPNGLRTASNNGTSNGWTCYYVNSSNCNTLSVEPGDIIDSPSTSATHTAMVLSVSGGNITCVQCNLSGNCKVYWTQNFNYNTKNATLSQIYSRFGSKGTIRLWKPSEAMKQAIYNASNPPIVDNVAPSVGAVKITNSNGSLAFSCTATDNIGITSAWAIITDENGTSKRFEASISNGNISGYWYVAGFSKTDGDFTVTVYAQDAAGNIGSNTTSTNLDLNISISPRNTELEVGEKSSIDIIFGDTLYIINNANMYSFYGTDQIIDFNYTYYPDHSVTIDFTTLKPGSVRFEYLINWQLNNPPGSQFTTSKAGSHTYFMYVYIIPNTPTISSVTNIGYKKDHIEFTPIEYAETYDLYIMHEGIDSDYQLAYSIDSDNGNYFDVEHIADGSTYYYKIVAKAAMVKDYRTYDYYYPTSKFSNIVTSTTPNLIPTNLSAVSNNDNEIELSWDAVDNISEYAIYRHTDRTEKELLTILDPSMTNYKDLDVDGGITYYYEVCCIDTYNNEVPGTNVSCLAKGYYEEKTYCTVSFESGIDDISIPNKEVEINSCLSLPSLEDLTIMDGYNFIGWYTGNNGTGEKYTSETPITSNIILYAYWKENTTEENDKLWIAPIGDQKYTGKAIKPNVQVYDGNRLLTQGIDYTVSYKNNIKICNSNAAESSKVPSVIVKGKNNYSDKATATFSIVAVDMNDARITVDNIFENYSGKVIKALPKVYDNGKQLKNNKDYILNYSETLKEIGEYDIHIIGIGGYTGDRSIKFTITDKILLSKIKVNKIPNQIYNGSVCKPFVTAKYGKLPLTEDVNKDGNGDYTVSYINNRKIGTATVVLSATENSRYIGTKSVTYKIVGSPISKASIMPIENQTYSGNAIKPLVNLYIKEKAADGSNISTQLVKGIDYTIDYKNNVNVGTAKVIITGKGNYSGTKTVSFKILPYDLSKLPAKSDMDSSQIGYFISVNNGEAVAYQKGSVKPPIEVSYSDYTVISGTSAIQTQILTENDYKVVYKNSKFVSSYAINKPSVTVSGKGNYKGTITSDTAVYEIVKSDLSNVRVTATDVAYNSKPGSFSKTKITVYDVNGKKLSSGSDYSKNYTFYNVTDYFASDETAKDIDISTIFSYNTTPENQNAFETELNYADAGTSQTIKLLNKTYDTPEPYQIICVKIKATENNKCNYYGDAFTFYRISMSDISKSSAKTKGSFIYTGIEQTLKEDDLIVTIGKGANSQILIYGKDYLIDENSYTNNIKVGTATVNIYGIGNYYGTKKITFSIKKKTMFFN